jgi:hypothetical protein
MVELGTFLGALSVAGLRYLAKKLKLPQSVSVPAKNGDDRMRKKTKVELIAALQKPLFSVLAPRVVSSTGVNTEKPDAEHACTSTTSDEQAAKRETARMISDIQNLVGASKLKETSKQPAPKALDDAEESEQTQPYEPEPRDIKLLVMTAWKTAMDMAKVARSSCLEGPVNDEVSGESWISAPQRSGGPPKSEFQGGDEHHEFAEPADHEPLSDAMLEFMMSLDGFSVDMQIQVKTLPGKTITMDVEDITTTEELKVLIHAKVGTPPEVFKLLFESKQLEDCNTLQICGIEQGAQLHMTSGLRGAGLVRKHQTKTEAVALLKSKVRSFVKKVEMFEADGDVDVDETFTNMLENMDKSLTDLKVLKASGAKLVVAGLRTASNSSLQTLQDIMACKGGRSATVEQKLLKSVPMLFPTLKKLDNYAAAISVKQQIFTEDLLEIFAEEYMLYKNGEGLLDTSAFGDDVKDEIKRRKNLRDAGVQPEAAPQGLRCAIM